jgi:signal transduction histidine kinase
VAERRLGQLPAPDSSQDQVAAATRTLALLKQEADAVRAQLSVLREELALVQRGIRAAPDTQLLEANEQLVLAVLKAQAAADVTRRRVRQLTASAPKPPAIAVSGQLAQAEYQIRVGDLRSANEQLVLAALSAREIEADAEQWRQRQTAFVAMAAHELRNPLLPLRLAARLLTRASTDAQLAKVQETINSQVSQMARLIGDLLDGSRISTGKFPLERRAVAIGGILELAIETCRGSMEARSQRFTSAVPSMPLNVDGDAARLVQVFGNLLDNASKYTPEEGELSLRVVALPDAVSITVSDNGIGITAQALPHVFKLFVQDEHATVFDRSGLGIGLAVVRELVEAHGGSVAASSAGEGLGSEFTVVLPLFPPDHSFL